MPFVELKSQGTLGERTALINQLGAILRERSTKVAQRRRKLEQHLAGLNPPGTDMDNGYAMSLGLAIYVGDELKDMMARSGRNPSVSQGTDNWMLPFPQPSSSALTESCRPQLPGSHSYQYGCRTAVCQVIKSNQRITVS
jgi:hypothetical protein